MKTCYHCKELLHESKFGNNRARPDGLQNECKLCRKRHKQSPEYTKQYRAAVKKKVFDHYTKGKFCCAKCNFNNVAALTVDHIDGSGAEHRRELSPECDGGSHTLYAWIVKNKYPANFQILCMNCQWIKRFTDDGINCHVWN